MTIAKELSRVVNCMWLYVRKPKKYEIDIYKPRPKTKSRSRNLDKIDASISSYNNRIQHTHGTHFMQYHGMRSDTDKETNSSSPTYPSPPRCVNKCQKKTKR